jgi:hypothetical protein
MYLILMDPDPRGIRIFWLSWIRIRIGNPDPDLVRAKDIIVYDF